MFDLVWYFSETVEGKETEDKEEIRGKTERILNPFLYANHTTVSFTAFSILPCNTISP